jgi:UDP-glucose 4-epimerase
MTPPAKRRLPAKPAVLVTGGAGFIGSHLTRRLVEKGCRTTVIDNLHTGRLANLGACLNSIRFVEADIRNREPLERSMQGAHVVFHLAAQSNVLGASADVDYSMSTNVVGTANVVRAARAAGVRRVVFTSSREVYGEPAELPVPETAPLNPKNAYGMSKLAGEMCCGMSAGQGPETTIVRIANAYGPGDRERVIPRFIAKALAGSPLVVYGGNQVLDFVPVDYVVDALLRLGLGSYVPGPINIGSGQGTTILELAGKILSLSNSTSELQVVRRREIEVSRFVASTATATKLLGLEFQGTSLADLPRLVEWNLRGESAGAAPAMTNSALEPNGARDNWMW